MKCCEALDSEAYLKGFIFVVFEYQLVFMVGNDYHENSLGKFFCSNLDLIGEFQSQKHIQDWCSLYP